MSAPDVLSLPVDVPWQLLSASPDMMAVSFCDPALPFEWRSSLAISAYEPPLDQLPEGLCDARITMLKITASITGYEPSLEETKFVYANPLPDVLTEELNRIIGTYWGCWGVLLNVAVFPWPTGQNAPLEQYPHIVGLEPKMRDLYQAATDMNEVLTASRSSVDVGKSHSSADTTETGLELHSDYDSGQTPYGDFKGGWKATQKWGNTTTDASNLQTDASRESRETKSTTTNISQMYNLLTGYHLGTNRAVFLMLPRPHTLQPTDYRTFIHGLRIIEGIQEFFLIVSRPKAIQGLAVEARLETGHYPEDPTGQGSPQIPTSFEDFVLDATATPCTAKSVDLSTVAPNPYTIKMPGYVIDPTQGDPGHPGVSEIGSENPGPGQLQMTPASGTSQDTSVVPQCLTNPSSSPSYQATDDHTVLVAGTLTAPGGCIHTPFGDINRAPWPHLIRKYRVFTRQADPSSGPIQTGYMITGRSLCTAFTSGDQCVQPVPVPVVTPKYPVSILDEPMIALSSVVVTKDAPGVSRQPVIKELLRKIQKTMSTSWRMPSRRPEGEVGFPDSDYFKDQIQLLVPKETLQRQLSQVQGLPQQVLDKLDPTTTVAAALAFDLSTFVQKTGLTFADAAQARRIMLGGSA